MSKFDTLSGNTLGDYDMSLSEEDLNVNPSWSAQDIHNFTFPFYGVRSPFKARTRPKIAIPQALPSLPLDTYFDSPRGRGHSFSKRAAEEPKFYSPSPLCFGEVDAFANGAQAVSNVKKSSTEMYSGKHCTLDRIRSELERNSSSDDEGQFCGGGCSEKTGDGRWEGVLQLVKDLNMRFTESKNSSVDNTGTENAEKRKVMSEEILVSLSAIHENVETLKTVVPSMACHRAKFTALVQRQCTAAAGAVKLMSQLGDAAVAIGKDIQRQLDAVSSHPCESNDRCNENSATAPNNPDVSSVARDDEQLAESAVSIDCRIRSAQPADCISAANELSTAKPVTELSNCEARGNYPIATSAFELLGTENECASSLVADLFCPCDRLTGVEGFATPPIATTSGIPFSLEQWENELEEVIRTDCVSQLKSEALILDNPVELPPSRLAGRGGPDAEPTRSGNTRSGDDAHDESDDGDTEASDQLPTGSFTLMEIDDLEILTEQTHYCNICSKGFKRDANLRMHMRSHGGKYKSTTTLGRSDRAPKLSQETVPGGESTRYSCPFVGCTRNMRHPKFQPLKTMLCLKNHYRRSHCAKTLQCSKCKSKQFSVVADLKTHEKHCGSADRWACSCGTTFSRKEKLYGHIRLFVGHVPVDISTRGS